MYHIMDGPRRQILSLMGPVPDENDAYPVALVA